MAVLWVLEVVVVIPLLVVVNVVVLVILVVIDSVIDDCGRERLYKPLKRVLGADRFIRAKRFVSRSLSVCVCSAAADWFTSYRDCLGAVSHYFIWRDSCLASVAERGRREVHRWRGRPGRGF